jgi:ribosomal protein S18 acetylase RimI-like enzyme
MSTRVVGMATTATMRAIETTRGVVRRNVGALQSSKQYRNRMVLRTKRSAREDELFDIQTRFSRDDAASGTRTRKMRESDAKACIDLVYGAFEGTEDAKPRAYVLKYLIGLATGDAADEVALVAERTTTTTTDASEGETTEIVGFVTVSISGKSRPEESDRAMSPPADAAYLANACVGASSRRRGVGRALLRAVEALVLEMGGCDVWLHVRLDQPAPCALYSGDRYEEVARDKSLGAFASIFGGGKPSSPRALMRKSLRDDGSCNFML